MDNKLFDYISKAKSLSFMLEKVPFEELETMDDKNAWIECFFMLKECVDKAYEICE